MNVMESQAMFQVFSTNETFNELSSIIKRKNGFTMDYYLVHAYTFSNSLLRHFVYESHYKWILSLYHCVE